MPPLSTALYQLQHTPPPSPGNGKIATAGKAPPPLFPPKARASSEVIEAPLSLFQTRSRASSLEGGGQAPQSSPHPLSLRRPPALSKSMTSPKSIIHHGRARSCQEIRPHLTNDERRARCRSASNVDELKSDPKMTIQTLVRTLPKHIRKFGATHESTAALYNELGNAHFRIGQNDAAAKAYKKAVACDPGEHLVSAYSNLATVYWKQGQVKEAINFLQQAWGFHEISTLSSGKSMQTSPTAANICHQLGLCHSLSMDFDKALQYLEQAREIRFRIAGSSDVLVGRTIDAIGKVHWMKGDLDSAMQCHAMALSCLTKLHAPTINTLQNMARVHMAANRLEAAASVLGEVAKVQRMNLAQAVPGTPSRSGASKALHETLVVLADLHSKMDHRDQADRFSQEVSLLERNT